MEFKFEIIPSGMIKGYQGTLPNDIIIPERIDGVTVRMIHESVFKGTDIKNIFIPKKRLKNYAIVNS